MDQYSHRPAVGDDVVHGDQKRMFVIGKLDESSADHRSGFEVRTVVPAFRACKRSSSL